ncbi:MAG: hypothetical protein M1829_001725 [Trizodia sp. TS-e1964]|nr:MAG: hypothetical protein M1829_001725 [Trizodia sp. TS-e1964]
MAPSVPVARVQLEYPLYCADFNPEDPGYLVVAGGGGESKSGVKNKITLLDTSSQTHLVAIADVELSQSEDNVTSLAAQVNSKGALTIFAGINSSSTATINEHFRSFIATCSAAGSTATEARAKIEPIAKASLFTPSGLETYQRITRLSPLSPEPPRTRRLGAIATGLASQGEIIIFDSTKEKVENSQIHGRISLGKSQEAADLDIIENTEQKFLVAYCTDYEIIVHTLAEDKPCKTETLYIQPHPDAFIQSIDRPRFRALRWLAPEIILVLNNLNSRGGAELLVLLLPNRGLANVISQRRLHSDMKAAIGLEISKLSSSAQSEEMQFIIAVPGQNNAIEVLALDYSTTSGIGSFKTYTILKALHPAPMTQIALSGLFPPSPPNNSPHHVKLASVSTGNLVLVHTLCLQKYQPKSKGKEPRYVLCRPGTGLLAQASSILAILAIILVAFALQAFLEIRGSSPPYLGAVEYFTPGIRNLPNVPQNPIPADVSRPDGLLEILASPQGRGNLIHVGQNEEGMLDTAAHEDEDKLLQSGSKRWEDLGAHEKEGWKKKLTEAGQWAGDEAETVFKGVFFGQLAGIVAQAMGG